MKGAGIVIHPGFSISEIFSHIRFMKSIKAILALSMFLSLSIAFAETQSPDKSVVERDVGYQPYSIVQVFELNYLADLVLTERVPEWIPPKIERTLAGHTNPIFHPPSLRRYNLIPYGKRH